MATASISALAVANAALISANNNAGLSSDPVRELIMLVALVLTVVLLVQTLIF